MYCRIVWCHDVYLNVSQLIYVRRDVHERYWSSLADCFRIITYVYCAHIHNCLRK